MTIVAQVLIGTTYDFYDALQLREVERYLPSDWLHPVTRNHLSPGSKHSETTV